MVSANRPNIVIVDDEPPVLAALRRDLEREFGGRYTIKPATSGAAALDVLRLLARRREPVALLIADQDMPEMTGSEFLLEAIKLFPSARRVLLTAYADTQVAIRALNDLRLDHYLTKPCEPPEERLFPVVRELLDDWQASVAAPASGGIKLVGHRWSARSHEIKDFLARNLMPYEWLDVEANEDARHLVRLAGAGPAQLPLVLFPDGANLIQPTIVQLAERLGLRMRAERASYDLVIVGAGPAGLAAAVYGASEGLRTLLIEREAPGGQAGTSSRIENYLGFPAGLSGADLTRRAVAQATRFGAEILAPQEVVSVRVQDNYRVVTLSDGSEVSCEALLIATGVSYRRFETKGSDRLTDAGVYYGAAIPEALDAAGKDVFIVGGGNSAGQAAMYLSQYASAVTILVRGESLADTMSQYLIAQIEATPNVHVRTRTTVEEMLGETHLEAIRIAGPAGEETLPAAALFIYIGASPRTDWLSDVVLRDELGFILSGADVLRDGQPPRGWYLERDPSWLETSVPGVFVAGDVRHASVKRIASAAGEGAMAVQFVHQHLAGAAPRAGRRPAPVSYVEALRASPLFSGLADRDLELLAEMAQPIEVQEGQTIIEEGTLGDTLYVVLDGELAVSTARGGAEARIAILGTNQVVGEMAVLQQAPRTATVRALVNSRLLVITQATFLKMLMKNVATLREFLRTFATRLQDTESRVMQQTKMVALSRIAEQLDAPAGAIVDAAVQLGDALAESDPAAAQLQEIVAGAAAIAQLVEEFRVHSDSDGNGAVQAPRRYTPRERRRRLGVHRTPSGRGLLRSGQIGTPAVFAHNAAEPVA